MLIRHFSTHDISGGAAIASYRLHQALREFGHRSQMFVRYKKSDDEDVLQLPWRQTESLFRRLKRHIPGLHPREITADYEFNFDRPCELDIRPILRVAASPNSIICLHWINKFLDTRTIREIYFHFRAPIVWVIHDLGPLTGGCHYSFGCDGFTRRCGKCPRIGSSDTDDISYRIWQRKRKYLSGLPICFVAPSSWGEARVRESSLFGEARVVRIPLPMNTRIFRPMEKAIAREVMQLPKDRKVILFGATYLEDRRKGIDHLIASLEIFAQLVARTGQIKHEDIFLLVVGLNGESMMPKLPFAGRYTGPITDELMMALAYQAADIFVCPSVEDSGPMMISEAMLCGTPVVAFNCGIAPDVIEHRINGYLARYLDENDLAEGIFSMLITEDKEEMRIRASETAVQMHLPEAVALRHTQFYHDLLMSTEQSFTGRLESRFGA